MVYGGINDHTEHHEATVRAGLATLFARPGNKFFSTEALFFGIRVSPTCSGFVDRTRQRESLDRAVNSRQG